MYVCELRSDLRSFFFFIEQEVLWGWGELVPNSSFALNSCVIFKFPSNKMRRVILSPRNCTRDKWDKAPSTIPVAWCPAHGCLLSLSRKEVQLPGPLLNFPEFSLVPWDVWMSHVPPPDGCDVISLQSSHFPPYSCGEQAIKRGRRTDIPGRLSPSDTLFCVYGFALKSRWGLVHFSKYKTLEFNIWDDSSNCVINWHQRRWEKNLLSFPCLIWHIRMC